MRKGRPTGIHNEITRHDEQPNPVEILKPVRPEPPTRRPFHTGWMEHEDDDPSWRDLYPPHGRRG